MSVVFNKLFDMLISSVLINPYPMRAKKKYTIPLPTWLRFCKSIVQSTSTIWLARGACVFCSTIHDFFGNNAIPPAWTSMLPESWDESKTDSKGET